MPTGFLNSLWIIPILGVLILVHELGHFLAARLVGIRVEEFGIGLPPRLWGYTAKNGVIYSINWIPFGGFVKMYGQDDLRPDGGAAYGPDSFVSKSAPQRAFVLVAGVLMNLFLAVVIFIAISAGQGRPSAQLFIDQVVPNTPAQAAGWQPGDQIVAVNGQAIDDANKLKALTDTYAGREMGVTVLRGGQRIETTVAPRVSPPAGQGRTGVALLTRTDYQPMPLWQTPGEGVKATWQTLQLEVSGLRQMVGGQVSPSEIAGPIGMGQITSEVVSRSTLPLWVTLGNLAGFLSLNLFLLNLLPIPALDGGRLVFVILEMLRGGRKVAPEREGMVHFIGLLVLLTLMFVIAFGDISRIVRGQSLIP